MSPTLKTYPGEPIAHNGITETRNHNVMSITRGQSHTAVGEVQAFTSAPGTEPANMQGCDCGAGSDFITRTTEDTEWAARRASDVVTVARLDANEIENRYNRPDPTGVHPDVKYDMPKKQQQRPSASRRSSDGSGEPRRSWASEYEADVNMHPHAIDAVPGSVSHTGGRDVGSAIDAATAPVYNTQGAEINPYEVPPATLGLTLAGMPQH